VPVSHSHRFVFIHIPKTGGLSLRHAFQEQNADLEFVGYAIWDLPKEQRTPELVRMIRLAYCNDALASFPLHHLPAAILRKMLPREVWDQYFKFAFVRNPWDRLVSSYYFYQVNLGYESFRQQYPDVVAMCERCGDFGTFIREYAMYVPDMTSHLVDDSGNISVDFVGRFERLHEDWNKVGAKIGLNLSLPHENRSEHEHYRKYYTAETRRIVEQQFARDIELFGYSF